MSLPSDVTVNNLKDFYAMILPYLNVGNGGTSDTPLGQVAFFDDVVAPAGWLIADGSTYNIADYPDLANQYERVHGSKNYYGGNGTTTFAVPDLQGEFLRASGTNSHTNQGSGAAVGVHQDGTIFPKVLSGTDGSVNVAGIQGESGTISNPDSTIIPSSGCVRWSSGTTDTGTTYDFYTSRPTNTSLLLCVKAVPSSEMNTYSTTERRVGTWIDGKPLYQKTFYLDMNITKDAWNVTDITVPDVDTLVYGCSIGPDSLSTYVKEIKNLFISVNTSSKLCFHPGIATGKVTYITMQYTKTTD